MTVMTRTVLIVDDHPSFRATARALLQAEGFDVVGEAVDGADALAKVRELRPEVVLLDVQLPDLDGFEIASRLCRQRPFAGGRARLEPRRGRLRRADPRLRRARLHPEGRALRRDPPLAPRLSRRTFALAVLVAVVEVAGALGLILTSDHEEQKAATAALALTAGISFIAAGLIALYRRPENRTGFYLAAVGYLWFLGALAEANDNSLYTLGVVLSNLAFIPFAALVLAFPTGRLAPRPDRLLVRITAAFVLIGPPLLMMFAKQRPGCADCGDSAIVVVESPTTETIVDSIGTAITVGIIVAVVAVLVRRWRRATPALRRVLIPVYLTGGAALVILLLGNVLAQVSTEASDTIGFAFLLLFAAVPFAFLLRDPAQPTRTRLGRRARRLDRAGDAIA